MSGICYVVGAGECPSLPIVPVAGDLLIAADGGYGVIARAGLRPDLAVGDFDSLGIVPADVPTECHPAQKDDTDMMLAVKIGLARGYRRFEIYGGLGGRLDHTLANLHVLAYLCAQGAHGWLIGARECITVIRDAVRFPADAVGTVSVFAWGGAAHGVCERGLAYGLTDATLLPDFPVGVSNEFTGAESKISVRDGMLVIAAPSARGAVCGIGAETPA